VWKRVGGDNCSGNGEVGRRVGWRKSTEGGPNEAGGIMRDGLRPVVIAATSSPVSVVAPLRTQHVASRTAICFGTGHALTAAVTATACHHHPPAAEPRRERPSRFPKAI